MGFAVTQTYLADILHAISQALLVPVIIVLIAFICYALFCIGSVIAEYFTERKHFKVVMPRFLAALMDAKQAEIPSVIEESGLLKSQKEALQTVYEYRGLPGDALIALIKREVNEEEARYDRIRSRNAAAARISPMVGLMGTLIPLGPGIQALGQADTAALSSSLLVAFDTTVAGLVVAAVCLAVGKIRGTWYDDYLSALDSAMATMLEKIEAMRAEDTPSKAGETAEAALPEAQEAAEAPEMLEASEVPEAPEVTEAPEVAEALQEPATPAEPATSEGPATPAEPVTPEEPASPKEQAAPQEPQVGQAAPDSPGDKPRQSAIDSMLAAVNEPLRQPVE